MAKRKKKRKPRAKAMGVRRGRPSKLTPELIEKTREAARRGATNAEIAKELGVCTATVYTWQGNSTEFLDAIKTEKDKIDDLVENSLFKRAMGYTVPEEHIHVDKYGNEHKVQSRKVVEGNVSAMIFWLKNRRPQQWRDKREIELGENTRKSWGLSYSLEEKPDELEVESEVLEKDA